MGCGVSGAEPSANAGPVITFVKDPRSPYPLAQVEGRLSLQQGCLLIDGTIAVWPGGTTWDADNRQVLFSGDFHRADPAPVDAHFSGGGGTFEPGDDLSGARNNDTEAAIRDCMARTRATRATFVYPEWS